MYGSPGQSGEVTMKLLACLGLGCGLVGACTGFSSEATPPANAQPDASADGGGRGIEGQGVADTISITVDPSSRKTWVIGRPNEIKFTATRGDGVTGAVIATLRGLSPASAVVPANLAAGVSQGTVTFTPSADSPQGELSLTLEAKLLDSAAKATAKLDGSLRGAPGDVDTGFATKGLITIPSQTASAVGADGRIYAFRTDSTTERYLADGRLDTTFGVNGRGTSSASVSPVAAQVAGNFVYVLCFVRFSGGGIRFLKVSLDGQPDTSFGTDGDGYSSTNTEGLLLPMGMARSASGQLAAVGNNRRMPVGGGGVSWMSPAGTSAALDDTSTERIPVPLSAAAWDGIGLLVVGGHTLGRMTTGTQHYGFANFVSFTGNIDLGANLALYGIDMQGSNILVSGIDATTGAPFLAKFRPNANGSFPGFAFQPAAVFFDTTLPTKTFLLGDGSILQVGRVKGTTECAISRYAADGTPDLGFGTKGVAALPVSPCAPTNIAVQPDGKIIVDAGSLGTPTTALSTRIVRLWN
jgi:uncharacterized delta-60 repeat protein